MEYAYSREIGTRRILDTDHPIKAVVYKGRKREWILAVICNGIGMIPRSFKTKKAAIASASGSEWAV
jgi:hypothetical protein